MELHDNHHPHGCCNVFQRMQGLFVGDSFHALRMCSASKPVYNELHVRIARKDVAPAKSVKHRTLSAST